jgi:hypothetical protein
MDGPITDPSSRGYWIVTRPRYISSVDTRTGKIRDRMQGTPADELLSELEAHLDHPDVRDCRPE